MIERVSRDVTSDALRRAIGERPVLVPLAGGRIVGRSMAEVLQTSRNDGQSSVRVQSIITVLGVHARLGFGAVWEHWHSDERTVVMGWRL